MKVRGVSHVPVQVRDIDESLVFWRDFLGMRVALDLEEIHEQHGVHRRGVYLKWHGDDEGPFVVLGQPVNRESSGEPLPLFSVGIDHIGFEVDDVAAFIERAEAMGVLRRGKGSFGVHAPEAYGAEGSGHVRSVMFIDPNGVTVQLDEWRAEPANTTGVHLRWEGAPSRVVTAR